MSRLALIAFVPFYLPAALAHPGHDAPEPHVHAIWEVLLVTLIAVFFVIQIVKRKSSQRGERKVPANSSGQNSASSTTSDVQFQCVQQSRKQRRMRRT